MTKKHNEEDLQEDLDYTQEIAFLLEEEEQQNHEQNQPRTR